MRIFQASGISVLIALGIAFSSCSIQEVMPKDSITTDTIRIEETGNSLSLRIDFAKGEEHNHPTFAIWLEDMDQKYIRTIFVTQYIATGIYGHGPIKELEWDNRPGPQKRPATLPYWLHKRSAALSVPLLPDMNNLVLDGYTGATPKSDFVIETVTPKTLPRKFRVLMEINQSWDWNEYWTNGLYNDVDYKTSSQPSLIYAVSIDLDQPETLYFLNPIGHGHFAGKDGHLYTDLRTMTTALRIIHHVSVDLINTKK